MYRSLGTEEAQILPGALLASSLSPLFTFVQCQEMKRREEIHVNTFTTLIVYYGVQVKLVVGSQV